MADHPGTRILARSDPGADLVSSPSSRVDRDNSIRWHGQPNHHEVWFLHLVDPRTSTGFWIRYTLHASPDGGLSATRLWFASFVTDGRGGEVARYLEQPLFLPPATGPGEFALELAAGRMTTSTAVGRMVTPEGEVEWDLGWTSGETSVSLLPEALQRLAGWTGRGVLMPAPAARFSGMIRIGERRFAIERAPGGQAHHWGSGPWRRWVWFGCAAFEDTAETWLEGLALPLGAGPLRGWPCAATLRWDGRLFELNDLPSLTVNRARVDEDGLQLLLGNHRVRISGLVRTPPDDQVLVTHGGGDRAVCSHHCEVADAELRIEERSRFGSRWLQAARLRARRSFHWEHGTPTEDFRVRRKLLPAG